MAILRDINSKTFVDLNHSCDSIHCGPPYRLTRPLFVIIEPMKQRVFGKTGVKVSEIGLGTWQLGGDWGDVSEKKSLEILNTAANEGVTFFDTADVYGAGRSEKLVGQMLKERKEGLFVASKIGRWDNPGWPDNFTLTNMRLQVEASIQRLGVEALDLVQLHCIPTETLKEGKVFDNLRTLKKEGKIKDFGVSVETMEEALTCLKHDDLVSLQIIFNIMRQKPIDTLFDVAKKNNTAIIVRLPLASGLLSGKMTKDTEFSPNDHRSYNRDGQMFNVGETFAGLPYKKGVDLTENIKTLVPGDMAMAQMALRWVLDFDAVSVVIPGASRPEQVSSNVTVSEMSPLSSGLHEALQEFYNQEVASHIRGAY